MGPFSEVSQIFADCLLFVLLLGKVEVGRFGFEKVSKEYNNKCDWLRPNPYLAWIVGKQCPRWIQAFLLGNCPYTWALYAGNHQEYV